MKAIYKTIAIVLLSGTGIGSIQAQNTTSQPGLYGNVSTMPLSTISTFVRQPMKPNKIK